MICGLTTTTVLYLLVVPLLNSHMSKLICGYEQDDDEDIGTKDNLLLVFLSLLQMTPCIYLAIAFYYIPNVDRTYLKFLR
jgi:hypothetical protein